MAKRISERLEAVVLFFSIKLLVSTLFDPFRQIDAGGVRGSLGVQMRAFFDRSFSRVIGMFVRLSVIGFGLTVAAVLAVVGLLQLIIWPLVPFLPIIGIILALMKVGV